ncbi:archaea-specific SMC-related protein [Haloarcula laminariae]|uniref:archaea-specific SMC-related protein n=1 Tax=Haloarcula laminariae TaxID=2961577 RepID=UPI0021CA27F6|nr:archaea-specific SMC-related protein [Halomicroarcula laminariae]
MWDVRIRNIGGIRAAEASLDEGLNVVQASNFMGKSSFVRAIQTVMGTTGMYGESHPLREGTNEGSVHLDTPDGSYEITLESSEPGTVSRHGKTFLGDETDQTCARLFAFLGENNPIRARVREQSDLTELLQAPLGLEDIENKVAARKRERESKRKELEQAERAAENLPSVQEAIGTLEDDIESLRERRDELSESVGDATDADSRSDELAEKRSNLQSLDQRINGLQDKIERTETKLDEKRGTLESLTVPDEPEPTADIEAKESRIAECEQQIDLLEGLHRANKRVIEEDAIDLVSSVERSVVGDEFDCWVCGEPTTSDTIESRLAAIQDKIIDLREEKENLTEEIEEIEKRQRRYREKQREKESLEEEIGRLKATLDDRSGDLAQAEERRAGLASEIEELEVSVAAAEEELSEELTDIKATLQTKERELDAQRSRLQELQELHADAATLREDIEALDDEIARLRNRKTKKQWELKEEFDTAMAAAIDRFAPGFDGARLDVKTTPENEIDSFELVIARDGRETTIQNLSEGERELVGIVVAVAGYRTFDVADRVPLILLDGISQLSAANLRSLIEYLSDASELLVTTAYPEAGTFDGHHISPNQWDTVSDEETPTA